MSTVIITMLRLAQYRKVDDSGDPAAYPHRLTIWTTVPWILPNSSRNSNTRWGNSLSTSGEFQ